MHSKWWLRGYGLLICCLFWLLPESIPQITGHMAAGLLYGFEEQPLLLAMFSALDLLFDYVSLSMPLNELRPVRAFVLVRTPKPRRIMAAYLSRGLPYLICFMVTKLNVLLVWSHPVVWLWLGSLLLIWTGILLIKLRCGGPSWHVLVLLAALRVAGHFLL